MPPQNLIAKSPSSLQSFHQSGFYWEPSGKCRMIDFDRLWRAYPVDYAPCRLSDGTPAFDNQCAIRFGIALGDGGVDLRTFPGVRCWHGHSGRHLLRGEEIAAWMKAKPEIFGTVTIKTSADETTFLGRRGLIFCRNFWGSGNQGDHIDLWNRDHLKGGSTGYISRSEEVWFWEIDAVTLTWLEKERLIEPMQRRHVVRWRPADQATDAEKEIAQWFIENNLDAYDISVLPTLKYSRQYLVDGWGLAFLVKIPLDSLPFDKVAIFHAEGTDSVSENGVVRVGAELKIYDTDKDNGGKRMSSKAAILPDQSEVYVGYVFDGQEYYEILPS
jgi:hypothetical protein